MVCIEKNAVAAENNTYSISIEKVLHEFHNIQSVLLDEMQSGIIDDRTRRERFTKSLRRIELTKCPSDFRVAFVSTIHMLEKAIDLGLNIPNSDTLEYFLYSLGDGPENHKMAKQAVYDAINNLEVIAVKHGVALENFDFLKQ